MARVNWDDSIEADRRFKKLVRIMGSERLAKGTLIDFWRTAQKYWGDEMSLMSSEEFQEEDFSPILESGLAESRANGIYAKGAEERFDWYLQKCRASRSARQKKSDTPESPKNDVPVDRNREKHESRTTGDHIPEDPPVLALVPTLALDIKTPVVPLRRGRRRNLNSEATRIVARVIGAVRKDGPDETRAKVTIGEEAWRILREKYPDWESFCRNYVREYRANKGGLFEKDLKDTFKAFLEQSCGG